MTTKRTSRKLCFWLGFILLAITGFLFSYANPGENPYLDARSNLMADVARLYPKKVKQKIQLNSVEDLQGILKQARDQKWKVSISGSRHSQGGHVYSEDGITINMRAFNKILSIDPKQKILTAQSGATWNEVQQAINPLGLAVKVMQSSYIFTLGGTLSANAHGRDLDQTSIVETVRSFRLLKADGTILNVSRDENPELFRLVIGGYGLFGIILEVDLNLTENEIYEREAVLVDYRSFPEYFRKNIQGNPNVRLFLARPSIDPETFMKEIVITTWGKTDLKVTEELIPLGQEQNVLRDRILFGLSRDFSWGKKLRWSLQKKFESDPGKKVRVTRNNAMRPPATPLKLLDYFSTKNTDIIQEYFIPIENFVPFLEEFGQSLKASNLNVISSTIRYVKANDEVDLSYAPQKDCFAIIQMSNVELTEKAQLQAAQATQGLVDIALKWGGTYYLTYQLYPSAAQLQKAYPRASQVFKMKKNYDPDEIFTSLFYEHYKEELLK